MSLLCQFSWTKTIFTSGYTWEMQMSQFKPILLSLTLVLFEFASIGYSQDNTEQQTIEPVLWESLFRTVLIVLVILTILALVVFFVVKMVRQWRAMWQKTQTLSTDINHLTHELKGKLDAIQKASMGNANKLSEIEPMQASIQKDQNNIQFDIGQIRNYINQVSIYLEELNSNRNTDIEDTNVSIDYPLEVEKAVQSAKKQVLEIARAYENGEPIELIDVDSPTPSQKVLIILNSMAYDLGEWKAEIEQSATVNSEFVGILTNAKSDIRDRLKRIRSESPIVPMPLNVKTDVNTEIELTHIRNQCIAYAAYFEGMLTGYELKYRVDEEEYNQFIPQFIRYRLFNEVADFVPFEDLPEKMERFLRFLDSEVVPIEIGITKADSHVHDIRESRQTEGEPGTVVEIVSPGLRRIADGEIIQKPVVIRGE